MAKLDIDFVLLDESVVQFGFRCLMGGANLQQFFKNPVMLFQHNRAEAGYSKPLENDVVLVIGKWYDLRIVGDKLLGKPDFDDDDDFAKRIQKKVEKGYYNAASVCLDPIAVSNEPALMLPGQIGPTVTEWAIYEASIVDIPNCKNALAIRNSGGAKIQLSGRNAEEVLTQLSSLIPQNTTMDKKLLAAKLGLSENASDNEISIKLAAMFAEAGKVTALNDEIVKLKADKVDAETKLTQLKAASDKEKIEALVDGAITAKKLAAGEKDRYIKLATADYDTTKEVIDNMKPFESPEEKLNGGATGTATGNEDELAQLKKLSGQELYMQDKFERLKKLSMPDFKVKFKEYYKVEYTGA